MIKVDFNTKCAVQILVQNHNQSLSQFTYERSNLLSIQEIIADAMNVFDNLRLNNDHWHFMTSVNAARTSEEYDDLLTDEDLSK